MGALNLLILLTARPLRERLLESISWVLGGVKVSGWEPVGLALPAIAGCLVLGFVLARQLDYLALGGAGAVRLGVNVNRLRIALLLAASLLTAVAVALAGIVALVGLLVPHAARLVLGPANRLLLPVARDPGRRLPGAGRPGGQDRVRAGRDSGRDPGGAYRNPGFPLAPAPQPLRL